MKGIGPLLMSAMFSLSTAAQDLQERISQAENTSAQRTDRGEAAIEEVAMKSPDLVLPFAVDADENSLSFHVSCSLEERMSSP